MKHKPRPWCVFHFTNGCCDIGKHTITIDGQELQTCLPCATLLSLVMERYNIQIKDGDVSLNNSRVPTPLDNFVLTRLGFFEKNGHLSHDPKIRCGLLGSGVFGYSTRYNPATH